jgi:hypothetical protein
VGEEGSLLILNHREYKVGLRARQITEQITGQIIKIIALADHQIQNLLLINLKKWIFNTNEPL